MNVFDVLPNQKRVAIMDGEKVLILLDAALNENHSLAAEATSHPIETGFSISDNIINQPRTYTLEGLISDDPVDVLQEGILDRTIGWSIPDELKSRLNCNLMKSSNSKPSAATFHQLEEIFERRLPVQIQCDLKLYKNMVMTSLNIPRSYKEARALRFNASFKQITIVDVEYIAAPKRLTSFEINAHPVADWGKQAGEGLSGDQDLRSQLKRIVDWGTQVLTSSGGGS